MNSHTKNRTFTAAEICKALSAELIGDGQLEVSGSNFPERATANELTFAGCGKNLCRIAESAARVVIAPKSVADSLSEFTDRAFILVDGTEPEAAFLEIAAQITPRISLARTGISAKATIAETAIIGAHTTIRDFAYVGENVTIGDNCEIHSGVVIQDGGQIRDDVQIGPNSVLQPSVTIGSQVTIEACSALGGDGFGYRTVNGQHEWLPHIGTVNVCDNVRIGSGTVIDRAKMGDTRINSGTRIDNQVMIAHNCQIGEHNLIVSQAGIAGSVTTGKYVVIAGQVGIKDHVTIGDHSLIGAQSGVNRDTPGNDAYLGSPARKATDVTRQLSALTRLPEMRTTVKALEKQVTTLQNQVEQLLQQLKSTKDAKPTKDAA